MKEIIATVIGVILVLGLIAYALLPQQEGVRDLGDKSLSEQSKINALIDDPNKVTGSTAKAFFDQDGLEIIYNGTAYQGGSGAAKTAREDLKESQVYQLKKSYGSDGSLSKVDITIYDMSK